jgi:hypothetical protein
MKGAGNGGARSAAAPDGLIVLMVTVKCGQMARQSAVVMVKGTMGPQFVELTPEKAQGQVIS